MKNRILATLSAIAAAATAIGGIDLAGIADIMPREWAAVLAIVPPIAAAVVHLATAAGDVVDDGKANGSFNPNSKK